jgi:23S rRNA-intervening sequence protein
MQDFRNLRVWQTARRLTRIVYEVTADLPQAEEFGIRSQLRRARPSASSSGRDEKDVDQSHQSPDAHGKGARRPVGGKADKILTADS